jgi:hypothetical protein
MMNSELLKNAHFSVIANPYEDLISGQKFRGRYFSPSAIGSYLVAQSVTGTAPAATMSSCGAKTQ